MNYMDIYSPDRPQLSLDHGKREDPNKINETLKHKGVVEKYAALLKGQEGLADIIENLTTLTKKNPDLAKKYGLLELKEKYILFHDSVSGSYKNNIERGLELQDLYRQSGTIILGMFKAMIDNPEKEAEKERTYGEPIKKEVARFKEQLAMGLPESSRAENVTLH